MAYGKREGIAEKEPKRGEYSTISRNNIVWMNSREIKDFIRKQLDQTGFFCTRFKNN
jgi:hypothetical protein